MDARGGLFPAPNFAYLKLRIRQRPAELGRKFTASARQGHVDHGERCADLPFAV